MKKYTMPEVEKMLGLSHVTVLEMVHSGALDTITLGKRKYCTPEQIDAYLNKDNKDDTAGRVDDVLESMGENRMNGRERILMEALIRVLHNRDIVANDGKRRLVEDALNAAKGNRRAAADALGMKYTTFGYYVRKFGL